MASIGDFLGSLLGTARQNLGEAFRNPARTAAAFVPGGLHAFDQAQLEREAEMLDMERIRQAMGLARSAEGRAQAGERRTAEMHPLDVKGKKQGLEKGEVDLDVARRAAAAGQALSESFEDPAQAAFAMLNPGSSAVSEGIAPYGLGVNEEEGLRRLFETSKASAAGTRAGAPLRPLQGGGGALSGSEIDVMAEARFANMPVEELMNLELLYQEKVDSGTASPEEARVLMAIREIINDKVTPGAKYLMGE